MPVNAVHPNRSLSSKSVVRACKMKPAKWSVGGILSIYMKKDQKDLDYNIEVQTRNAIGEKNSSRAALPIELCTLQCVHLPAQILAGGGAACIYYQHGLKR